MCQSNLCKPPKKPLQPSNLRLLLILRIAAKFSRRILYALALTATSLRVKWQGKNELPCESGKSKKIVNSNSWIWVFRFDCRVTGRPYPEVTWYINGYPVNNDATHKILVNESGSNSLMITNVSRSDGGVVTCAARNKAGEISFQCNLNVIEKEQVIAPKFVERFTTTTIKEGEPVIFSARAVATPPPRITWQKVRKITFRYSERNVPALIPRVPKKLVLRSPKLFQHVRMSFWYRNHLPPPGCVIMK